MIANPGFESGLEHWTILNSKEDYGEAGNTKRELQLLNNEIGDPTESGVDFCCKHSGKQSLCIENQSEVHGCSANQKIIFQEPIKSPFEITAYYKTQNLKVYAPSSCGLFTTIFYADDTKYDYPYPLESGSADWKKILLNIRAPKPVKSIEINLKIGKATGKVWFDDVQVGPVPMEFTACKISENLFGKQGFELVAATSLPCSWEVEILEETEVFKRWKGRALPVRVSWEDTSLELKSSKYLVKVTAKEDRSGEIISLKREVNLADTDSVKPCVVWVSDSMEKVMPFALPDGNGQEQQAIKLAAAKNEYEVGQFAILPRPGTELKNIQILCSDLTSPSGSKIPAKNIRCYQIGYFDIQGGLLNPFNPYRSVAGWYPDALLPIGKLNIKEKFSQSVWVEVYTPQQTPAGIYTGAVAVKTVDGEKLAELPLTVKVYDFSLPSKNNSNNAFAIFEGYLEKNYGKLLTQKRRRQYDDLLIAHRLNPDDITRHKTPAIEDIEYYKSKGMTTFCVRQLVDEDHQSADGTWIVNSSLEVYTEDLRQRLKQKLYPYIEGLREHDLTDGAYIYTFDESRPEYWPVIKDFFGMVKEEFPEVKTFTTAKIPQDSGIMDQLNVDWLCPIVCHYRPEQAQMCRQNGKKVWTYISGMPRFPYSNIMIDDALIGARGIWWQVYQQNADGLLYWSVNYWTEEGLLDLAERPLFNWRVRRPVNQEWVNFCSLFADGCLIYPGREGPVGSMRLANIRDGIEDYEYLYKLQQLLGDKALVDGFSRSVANGFAWQTQSAEQMRSTRSQIAKLIEILN